MLLFPLFERLGLKYNSFTFQRPQPHFGGGELSGGVGIHPNSRSHSPQIPHTYHNPTLMASPYSTLPRKMAAAASNGRAFGGPPPIMASSIGRNSPLLELTGMSSNRSSSLGRNTNLPTSEVVGNLMRPKGTPLMDDDRESCV